MLFLVWLKGVLMGLAIAAPVGPIALLCIRRTLAQGRLIGLLSGLGAASADGLYGIVAAFGLTAISTLLIEHTKLLQIGGGLFLCYLGLTTIFPKTPILTSSLNASPPNSPIPNSNTPSPPTGPGVLPPDRRVRFTAYTSTLLLTLTTYCFPPSSIAPLRALKMKSQVSALIFSALIILTLERVLTSHRS